MTAYHLRPSLGTVAAGRVDQVFKPSRVVGICYTARVCSVAAVVQGQMQQQICSAHTIAAGLPGSVFMPACLKSLHDDRYVSRGLKLC